MAGARHVSAPRWSQHPKEYNHALKEVDATACAVCQTVKQVVGVLKYVIKGKL